MSDNLIISFNDISTADANVFASSLADDIRDADDNVSVQKIRAGAHTQDFGASLAIVLGTASATAVARGIARWLARNTGVSIQVSTEAGKVLATNLNSGDAAKIVEALAATRR